MNRIMDKKNKKGFTLLELVIVLAIIGVLSVIVMLAWNRYIYAQRLRSANNNAKVLFNAAQAECIKISSRERTMKDEDKFLGSGDYYLYWDGHNAIGNTTDSSLAANADLTQLSTAINNILDSEGAYKIKITDYQVVSVAYAPSADSRYVGTYPTRTDDFTTGGLPSNFTLS